MQPPSPQRHLRHVLEVAAIFLFYAVFRLLPIDAASALGGWLGRKLGPRLGVHRTAERNLQFAMPELSAGQRHEILMGMWDNLGRTMGEFPHLDRLTGAFFRERVDVVGAEHIRAICNHPRGGLFFSGHLGNWELSPKTAFEQGAPLHVIYRHANNPYVDALIRHTRRRSFRSLVGKGPRGARALLRALQQGEAVGMLVDQKMNDGIAVPFFGHPAMTAPALANLAMRFGCPIVPARVIRLQGAHFRVVIYPPLQVERTSEREETATFELMLEVNRMLEEWVREYPSQWFWVHKRWPKGM